MNRSIPQRDYPTALREVVLLTLINGPKTCASLQPLLAHSYLLVAIAPSPPPQSLDRRPQTSVYCDFSTIMRVRCGAL